MSNRKGKRIIAYELNVTVTWNGSVDYDDVEGSLLLPYVSEDVTDGDFEVCTLARSRACGLPGTGRGGQGGGWPDEAKYPSVLAKTCRILVVSQIKWSAKQPNESSHKMALRYMQKQLPIIKERLKTFYDEINAK